MYVWVRAYEKQRCNRHPNEPSCPNITVHTTRPSEWKTKIKNKKMGENTNKSELICCWLDAIAALPRIMGVCYVIFVLYFVSLMWMVCGCVFIFVASNCGTHYSPCVAQFDFCLLRIAHRPSPPSPSRPPLSASLFKYCSVRLNFLLSSSRAHGISVFYTIVWIRAIPLSVAHQADTNALAI